MVNKRKVLDIVVESCEIIDKVLSTNDMNHRLAFVNESELVKLQKLCKFYDQMVKLQYNIVDLGNMIEEEKND